MRISAGTVQKLLAFGLCILLIPCTGALAADHVFVLDAGHGGEDGGAVAPDGTREDGINLDIVLRMRDIFLLYGVAPVLTRETEDIAYPPEETTVRGRKVWDQKSRTELVNDTERAVLISVHQNIYPTSSPHGAEVLWAPTEDSEALAVWTQAQLLLWADSSNKRSAGQISPDIFLMNHVSCPAILVECGFLSNPGDLERLETPEYRQKLAAVLTTSALTWSDHTEP